jgi:hypothetical protein
VRSRISKLQISPSSEEGKQFEDFENAEDFQHYEENFDDKNLGGDFDGEFGALDLGGAEDLGGDGDRHSHNHKASHGKAYIVDKDADSDVLHEEALPYTDSKVEKQKLSQTRFTHTVQLSSVQSDNTKENNPVHTGEDIPQQQFSNPQGIRHSYTISHQINIRNKRHPTSRDPVFSNSPLSGVEKRQEEEKSSETIFADNLKTGSQRKTLRNHQEVNKHSSS